MKLLGFLLPYVRNYWRWAILALGATVLYATSTVVLIQLLEPIFSEVLQIGSTDMPAGLGALLPERVEGEARRRARPAGSHGAGRARRSRSARIARSARRRGALRRGRRRAGRRSPGGEEGPRLSRPAAPRRSRAAQGGLRRHAGAGDLFHSVVVRRGLHPAQLQRFPERLRLPAPGAGGDERPAQRPLRADSRADQPVPRRAPLRRAGEPRRARRRRPPGGGLDAPRRPGAAVGNAHRPARPAVLDPVQARPLLRRGGAGGALSDRSLQQEHAQDESPDTGAHRRPRQPGLGVLSRTPGGEGLRHGGLRGGALPRCDAPPPARQPARPDALQPLRAGDRVAGGDRRRRLSRFRRPGDPLAERWSPACW